MRIELTIEGTLAGYTESELVDGVVHLLHTVTIPEYRGRGIAGMLVAQTVAETNARGLAFKPVCPYAIDWVEKNPDAVERLVK